MTVLGGMGLNRHLSECSTEPSVADPAIYPDIMDLRSKLTYQLAAKGDVSDASFRIQLSILRYPVSLTPYGKAKVKMLRETLPAETIQRIIDSNP